MDHLLQQKSLALTHSLAPTRSLSLTHSLALTHSLTLTHSLALAHSRSLTLSLTQRRSRQRGVCGAEPPRKMKVCNREGCVNASFSSGGL